MRFTIAVTILFLNLMSQVTRAELLLIPEEQVDTKTYLRECRKPGYICTHDFMINTLIEAKTPLYDDLISQFDLYNEASHNRIVPDINNLLKSEMVSVEQVESLIEILIKLEELNTKKNITLLKNDLQDLVKLLSTDELFQPEIEENSIIFFKRKISQKKFVKLKKYINQFTYYKINIFSYQKGPFKDKIILLTGDCEKYKLNDVFLDQFQPLSTQPIFEKECSFAKNLTQSLTKTTSFLNEYKEPILWTTLAASAIYFFANYNVEFK